MSTFDSLSDIFDMDSTPSEKNHVDRDPLSSCIPSEFLCSEFPNINEITFLSALGPGPNHGAPDLFVLFLPSCPDLATSVSYLETGKLIPPLAIPLNNFRSSQSMTLTTDVTKYESSPMNPSI